MKIQISPPDEGRLVLKLSSTSFALLLILVLLTPFVEMSGALSPDQKIYRLYGYALVLLLQILLIPARGLQRSLRVMATPALAFLLWASLSLAWAENLELAGKRVLLLWLVYIATFAAACDLGYRRSLSLVRVIMVVALTLNYIIVLAFPEFGSQPWKQVTLWRGIMAHKNIAGMFCALTVLLFAFDASRIAKTVRYAVLAAALFFLFQTWSRTALIALSAAIIFGLPVAFLKPSIRAALIRHDKTLVKVAWILFATTLACLLAFTMQRDIIISLTDDAGGLSLRNSIWRPMIQYYVDNPVMGSGYGAYWDSGKTSSAASAFSTQKWLKDIDQGHNGYLDLLVQTGLPGLALALYAAIIWPLTRLPSMLNRQPSRLPLVFVIIIFVLIENFTESSLFADDAIVNFFLLFALAQIHRFNLRSKSEPARRRERPHQEATA